jgi:hypothetical protein
MELQIVRPRNNVATSPAIVIEEHSSVQNQENFTTAGATNNFIEANTKIVDLQHLKNVCVIPNFSKDNESTISHQEFIDAVMHCAQTHFNMHLIAPPEIRVSHEIKGRIPEAIGKPAKDLLDHEKTIYYERMAFIMKVPAVVNTINGNKLMLTIGGVRAYNHENLYSKKSIEKFKVFIGFQNLVCTNLCISTDGFASELRVSHISDLQQQVLSLFQRYNQDMHLQSMENLGKLHLTEHQFAQLIGKSKLYYHLPLDQKKNIPFLDFNDGQINCVARDYYQDKSFSREEDGSINLWKLYNLFTGANKSSYIDSFLNRTVNAYKLAKGIENALQGVGSFGWLLN